MFVSGGKRRKSTRKGASKSAVRVGGKKSRKAPKSKKVSKSKKSKKSKKSRKH